MVQFLRNALVGVLALLPIITLAAPTTTKRSVGIYFETDTKGYPVLNLPYASYRAATYDKTDDVWNNPLPSGL